ncbi:hypothetical protein MAHJHV61_39870 [Mycobacterium avium subsp. hominissuis]|uniref:hypothetical protein n=1 Tax=Mycobacterium avium TaxID=1764 RepID=UPI00114E7A6B|nr:hypothetical protein [Mycobacterium avium]
MSGELFYTVPAEFVVAGVSTADGLDVGAVHWWGGHVAMTLTLRNGEPFLHPARRGESETRVYLPGQPVELCVFDDTSVDLSGHPRAANWQRWDGQARGWKDASQSADHLTNGRTSGS